MTTNIGTPLTFKCSETIRLRRVKPEESPTAYASLQPTGRQNLPQRPVRSKGHSTSRQMNLTKENALSRETGTPHRLPQQAGDGNATLNPTASRGTARPH